MRYDTKAKREKQQKKKKQKGKKKNQKKGKKDIATAKTNSNVTIFPEAAEKPNKYANLTLEEKQALVAEKLKRRSNQ